MNSDTPIFKNPEKHTVDHLLDNRVTLSQPINGFRAGIDAVLLSACVPSPKPNNTVLDIGCGVGSAGLCYATRVGLQNRTDVTLSLLDCNPLFSPYVTDNIQVNDLTHCTHYHCTDISTQTPINNDSIDHILTNPPYETAHQGNASPHHSKHLGNIETTADLNCWIKYCHRVLKTGGTLSMIHRADRLHHILHTLHGDTTKAMFGDIHILPVQSLVHKSAIRVLIHARKNRGGGCIIHPPFILQKTNQQGVDYTQQANDVLRDGKPIEWGKQP